MRDAAEPRPDTGPPGLRRGGRLLEAITLSVVVLADQITKQIVQRTLPLYESVNVIPGLLDITHVRNTGAAFGILNATDFPYKPAVMVGIALLALVAIAAYAAQVRPEERLARFGLALIVGGALGNLIDRAMAGYVTDFVDVYWGSVHFWAFNVADASITVGAACVVLDMLGVGRSHAPDTV